MASRTNPYLSVTRQFSLKEPKAESSLIRFRLTVGGEKVVYTLPAKYRIQVSHWDEEIRRAIIDSKRNKDLKNNAHLQNILHNINVEIEKTANAGLRILTTYDTRGLKPTAEQVKEDLLKELKGIEKEQQPQYKDFLVLFDHYVDLCRSGAILTDKGTKITEGTMKTYDRSRKAIERYCKDRKIKLLLSAIDKDFYDDFVSYYNEVEHDRGRYTANTIGSFIKHIKAVLKYAIKKRYIGNIDLDDFKVFNKPADSFYLSEEELERLYALPLTNKRREELRDGFVLSCYTGLRFSDCEKLEAKDIDFENKIIRAIQKKTKKSIVVPIHPIVQEIIAKYDGVPVIQSNQSVNRRIKELCDLAGINNEVTYVETRGGQTVEVTCKKFEKIMTHTGRRSFATNAVRAGTPTRQIMKVTGHAKEENFSKYVRLTDTENAEILQKSPFFNPSK